LHCSVSGSLERCRVGWMGGRSRGWRRVRVGREGADEAAKLAVGRKGREGRESLQLPHLLELSSGIVERCHRHPWVCAPHHTTRKSDRASLKRQRRQQSTLHACTYTTRSALSRHHKPDDGSRTKESTGPRRCTGMLKLRRGMMTPLLAASSSDPLRRMLHVTIPTTRPALMCV
jgi:hypothetical protein